ncbi:hypothetical protein ACFWPV_12590 [Streptomyces uncialis]|uniref:hypothetical protein n=1 Tax=Streptomyces uncialis TaxID=1048205 RepID=UPI0036512701
MFGQGTAQSLHGLESDVVADLFVPRSPGVDVRFLFLPPDGHAVPQPRECFFASLVGVAGVLSDAWHELPRQP